MSERPPCRLEPECPYLVSQRAEAMQSRSSGSGLRLPEEPTRPSEAPYCEWHIREGLVIQQAATCDEEQCIGPSEVPHWVLCPSCGRTMTEKAQTLLVGSSLPGLSPPPEPKPGEFDHGPYRYRCLCHEE